MDRDDFVGRIKRAVADAAIDGTVRLLLKPPGKKPRAELVELSCWFNELSAKQQRIVERTIKLAVNDAVFGFFAVLDGARTIDYSPSEKTLELYFVDGDRRQLLNPANEEPLHDIYNGVIGNVDVIGN